MLFVNMILLYFPVFFEGIPFAAGSHGKCKIFPKEIVLYGIWLAKAIFRLKRKGIY